MHSWCRDPILQSVSQGTTKNRILKGNLTTPFPFLRVCVCVCACACEVIPRVLLLHGFPPCSAQCRRTNEQGKQTELKKKNQ